MNAETADLLQSTLRSVLAEASGRRFVARLDELGWHQVAAEDPEEATGLLFEAQGRALVSTAALDGVVGNALGPVGNDAVIHPYPGDRRLTAGRLTAGGHVELDGIALATFDPDARLVAAVTADGAVVCVIFEQPLGGLQIAPLGGVAPELGFVRLKGTVNAGCEGLLRPVPWDLAVAAARRALAHELTGVTAVMLELAVDHAVNRVQFGRPIGRFQAVQHRLADCHVALEAARTTATGAAETGDGLAAVAAKALAGTAFRTAARHCQQVFGAIGFTWEHPFHSALRRGMVLDLLYGSPPELRRELGHQLGQSDEPFRHLVSL